MTLSTRIRLTLAGLFFVLLGVGATSYWSARRLLAAETWVDHTQRVVERLEQMQRLLLDENAAVQAYALTGDGALLGPYFDAESLLPPALSDLRYLTADDPAHAARLDVLAGSVSEHSRRLRHAVEIRKQSGAASAALIAAGEARTPGSQARAVISDLEAAENGLLRTRAAAASRDAQWTLGVIVAGTLLGLGVVLLGSVLSAYHVTRPLRRLQRMVERVGAGDLAQHVDVAGPPDLAALAASFNEMAARRRAAESSLRQTSVSLEAIVRSSPLAIVGVDENGRVDEWNPAAERLFGWPRDAVIGRPKPGIPDEVRAEYEAERERALRGQTVPPHETWRLRANGEAIEVAVASAPLRIDGEPRGTVDLVEDLGPRRHAEAERRRHEAEREALLRRMQTLFERAPVGMMLVDRERRVTLNPAAEQLYGRTSAPGAPFREYASQVSWPDGRPIADSELPGLRALAGEAVEAVDLVIHRDGREVPVLVGAAPLPAAGGVPQGAVIVIEDLTALKEVERLREEWNAVIAHDLRQPINTILILAELLFRRPDDPTKVAASATKVVRNARHLGRMVADLLDLSRLEAQRLKLERTDVDLPDLARGVAGRIALEAPGRDLRVDVEGEIPALQLDADRMDQVLTNLLTNAVKYGAEGTPIDVRIAHRDAAVIVEVVNRGAGIAASELANLFARFRRVRGNGARAGGVGLGLYVTKGLVEAHGGRIEAESVPGDATTFRVWLPMEHAERPA